MAETDWADEFPGAIIVTDPDGKIIYLNNKAALVYEAEGGFELRAGISMTVTGRLQK